MHTLSWIRTNNPSTQMNEDRAAVVIDFFFFLDTVYVILKKTSVRPLHLNT
jgi:hypothetical protein